MQTFRHAENGSLIDSVEDEYIPIIIVLKFIFNKNKVKSCIETCETLSKLIKNL